MLYDADWTEELNLDLDKLTELANPEKKSTNVAGILH
jgi:hypothetical protein